MKTTPLFSTGLLVALFSVCVLAATEMVTNRNPEPNTARQSVGQDAAKYARADAIRQAVLDAVKAGLPADKSSGRPATPVPTSANPDAAAAQATYSVMVAFFPESTTDLDAWLAQTLTGIDDSSAAIASGRKWGKHVAQVVLAEQADASSRSTSNFAESVQSSPVPAPVSVVRAEQAPIGPGRYRFTVLAGSPGTKGYVDSVGAAARFDNPTDITVDAAGNAYVTERDLGVIRKISPNGTVSTLAGLARQKGSQDGMGAVARFNEPIGVAVDDDGNVYVADYGNHTVRKIDPAGNVTTLAGKAGEPGNINGDKKSARLDSPFDVAVDDTGSVFVSENATIRKILPDGSVSTLALDLPYAPADYSAVWPYDLCVDRLGFLYAIYSDTSDFIDAVIFTPDGPGQYAGRALRPPPPRQAAMGLGVDDANNLYVAFDFSQIRRFAPDGGIENRYVTGIVGGDSRDGMTVDKSGRIFSLASGSSDRKGAIEVGVFDPVATDPVIIWPPMDQVLNRGGSTRFQVEAAGGGVLTYQWYFNANPIAAATGAFLSLTNVQDDAVGSYFVVVSDGTSSVTSRMARLTMAGPPAKAVPPATPTPPVDVGSGSATSGGGSFGGGMSAALLALLAAAARRQMMVASRVRFPAAPAISRLRQE